MLNRIAPFLIPVALLASSSDALGWGWQGHKLVGRIAWEHMTESARARSYELLRSGHDTPGFDCDDQIFAATTPDVAFTGAMSWADCARGAEATVVFPQFAAYHADRYALCPGLGASGCFTRHCASDVLWQSLRKLKDARLSELDHRVALKMVLHLMGDLHQPLHVTATGPVDVQVIPPGSANQIGFHAYWDSNVVALVEPEVETVLTLAAEQQAEYESGDLESWVLATHTDGQFAYAQLYDGKELCTALSSDAVTITAAYADAARELGRRKLAEGGIRLAKVLNDVLPEKSDRFFHVVEAEAFTEMSGIETDRTRDLGGTDYVGEIDAGDAMTYSVDIPFAARYTLSFRVSSTADDARFTLSSNAGTMQLGQITIPVTGDFEKWITVEHEVELPAGALELKLLADTGGWRLNWIELAGENPGPQTDPTEPGSGGMGGIEGGAGGLGGAGEASSNGAGDGGTNGAGGSAGGSSPAQPDGSPSSSNSGCACSFRAQNDASAVWALGLLLGSLFRRRRGLARRRRSLWPLFLVANRSRHGWRPHLRRRPSLRDALHRRSHRPGRRTRGWTADRERSAFATRERAVVVRTC